MIDFMSTFLEKFAEKSVNVIVFTDTIINYNFQSLINIMNFRKYLISLKSLLSSNQCSNFVLGNSGADYDSIIGSLLYAFYMTTSFKVLHLPIIDCPK